MILEPKRVSVRQPTIDDSVKVEPPPAPSAPNKQKKEKLDTNWKNNKYNRLDKGEYDLVFTKVLAKDLKDESFEVELLNSLPDEVLRANGWDEGSISRLQQTGKDKFVPYSVLEALTEKPDEIEQNEKPGRFFGQGGFGKVKFARIWPLGASKPIWCVAKKIKDYSLKYQTLQEVKLQAQAGVGPKVYGSADTVDKNNASSVKSVGHLRLR